jgi:hypothetical protein
MTPPQVRNPISSPSPGWFSLPALRYPIEYLAFVAVSSLDVILTWVILAEGGTEVNPIAAAVINEWDLPGAIMFKFSLTLFVVIVCEVVGRARERAGRSLICAAIVISSIPVAYSFGLLLFHAMQRWQ